MSEFSSPEVLNSEHRVDDFDCGKPALNDFLRLHALAKQNAMLSRTYVVRAGERVAGYHTLTLVSIKQDLAPKKMGRGMPNWIPAVLMARLAVDKQFQGRQLGRSLLLDAIGRTWSLMSAGPAPVRVFVVDAMDAEAKAFYERFDMVAGPDDPMRLFLFYKDLRALIEGD